MGLVIAVLASGCNRPARHNLWNDDEVVALLEKHPSVKAFFGQIPCSDRVVDLIGRV